jgi:hypothetical protein
MDTATSTSTTEEPTPECTVTIDGGPTVFRAICTCGCTGPWRATPDEAQASLTALYGEMGW